MSNTFVTVFFFYLC